MMEYIDGIKFKNFINDNSQDEEKIKQTLT